MGGSEQPFMYEAVKKDDDRYPATTFDPKAVTRASYERKKPKPKPKGPLISFGRHPDAQAVPSGRSNFRTMNPRTKSWIKGTRRVQLCLRVLEVAGAIGIVVVMGLSGLIGWVTGATCGAVTIHCLYSVFHHVRPAGSRTPGSSAGYHLFSSVSDLCVLPLYAYGALTTRNRNEEWKAQPPDDPNVTKYMVPAVYYGFIAAGGLHLISLAISVWLALMFRRISKMPPDMNPLEANFTSRVHKRNKSSVVTTSTYSDNEKCPDSQPYDDLSRPPSIPFMHTRRDSQSSIGTRDSRVDLPSRQYQIAPSNRSSATPQELKRMSAPPAAASGGSYMEIPLGETGASTSRPSSVYSSRPSTGTVPSYRAEPVPASPTAQPRSAKFTETWYASESLINRTQQRTRAMNQANAANQRKAYASLRQRDLDLQPSDSEDESQNENENHHNYYTTTSPSDKNNTKYDPANPDLGSSPDHHPNPLRSNPTPASPPPRRPRTPFSRLRASVLSELNLNDRRVSASRDITDARAHPRNRDSSIQPDAAFSAFYSKPYGELKPGTPPIMVGNGSGSGNRQVSSGNDYHADLGAGRYRAVSGKVAEEGRAGRGGGFSFE
ncbi:hypothetical protein MMYC01_200107 [Madurella mycetomatis]|uniref:Uncharacterized protein n=1 Tax=Madurella mycetomatis TaxID=100816 RepID=A0A150ASN9_9PEZI|nr:hypothetical protein MMYC01_200107 [Madurella mycetomatis]